MDLPPPPRPLVCTGSSCSIPLSGGGHTQQNCIVAFCACVLSVGPPVSRCWDLTSVCTLGPAAGTACKVAGPSRGPSDASLLGEGCTVPLPGLQRPMDSTQHRPSVLAVGVAADAPEPVPWGQGSVWAPFCSPGLGWTAPALLTAHCGAVPVSGLRWSPVFQGLPCAAQPRCHEQTPHQFRTSRDCAKQAEPSCSLRLRIHAGPTRPRRVSLE